MRKQARKGGEGKLSKICDYIPDETEKDEEDKDVKNEIEKKRKIVKNNNSLKKREIKDGESWGK